MKKVAIFGINAKYRMGGTESSINNMVSTLEKEYEVFVITGKREGYKKYKQYRYRRQDEIPLVCIKYLNYMSQSINYYLISKYFKDKDYDVVIANGLPSIAVVNSNKKKCAKTLYYVRDEYSLNKRVEYTDKKGFFHKFKRSLRRAIDFPFYAFVAMMNSKALKQADKVVSNSKFMAGCINEQQGVISTVIYPFTKTTNNEVINTAQSKYIMMIGDQGVKGVDTFISLSKMMPDHKFMIVGRDLQHHVIGNLVYSPFFSDIQQLYSNAELLLVPSIWQEAFGKVSIEAASYGVPAIVSKRGGLPETVCSDSLVIDDYKNPSAWKDRVQEVLLKKEFWKEKCQKYALNFDAKLEHAKLKKIIDSLLKI